MTDYEKIEEIARKNNNVFKTQMVIEAGIRKEKIREMLESGLIEKLGHGLYSLSKEDVDEYYAAVIRNRASIAPTSILLRIQSQI